MDEKAEWALEGKRECKIKVKFEITATESDGKSHPAPRFPGTPVAPACLCLVSHVD